MSNTPSTYAKAGVNIDAGNALVEAIKPAAKATMRTGCMSGLGGFGALFDLKAAGYNDPILVSGTDGVGTKLKLALEANKHDTIGIDLVAMCVNDLLAQGAEPLFFLDYYATGKLSVETASAVINGIAEGCRQSGCALVGGETAEMPGVYSGEDYDLAGFCVGAVNRDAVLPRLEAIQGGEVLLGLASSGVHSNGYSLVRHILKEQNVKLADKAPFADQSWADVLLAPTKLYVASCLAAIRGVPGKMHALAHITGGGITENIPRVLPDGIGARIRRDAWKMPAIFQWLQQAGNVEDTEMWRTFNCGIGMVLVVDAAASDAVIGILEKAGEKVYVLGETFAHTNGPRVDMRA